MYVQRYLPHLPAAGEVAIFDRSWYNRAGVERVMGFCTAGESRRFLELHARRSRRPSSTPGSSCSSTGSRSARSSRRGACRAASDDPRKIWKLSPLDLESYSRWYDYSRARDEMFRFTDTGWAPWFVALNDDKKRGRLNIISHLLSQIPYTPLERPDVTLPNGRTPADTDRTGPSHCTGFRLLTDVSEYRARRSAMATRTPTYPIGRRHAPRRIRGDHGLAHP